MKRICPIFVLFLCAGASAPARAQSLLPASVGGWNAAAASEISTPATFDSFIGPDAAILREYNLQSLERRAYARGNGAADFALYRFRDPSSAYGAYTYFRSDGLPPVQLGSFACASERRALIVAGNYLLDVTSKNARPSDDELKPLAAAVLRAADSTPFPAIGAFLPDPGRVRRSEHYVLGPHALAKYVSVGRGDWVGFDYSAEAIVASYHAGAQQQTLLLVSYPTQQIAAKEFDSMLRQFTFDPPGGPTPGQTVLYGKRASSLVAVVIGAASRDAANALLDQVQRETEVTWNEPKQTATDPSFSAMIVGAITGTGVIMLLSVAAGIGFGGVRLIVKFFFPHKVFDREHQVEILQLGISSKPIQAKDFY